MNREYKLPEVLKELLAKEKMSQSKLAIELDVSPEAINRWLKFKGTPNLFSAMAIAETLNVSLDYLVYGEQK